MMDGICLISKVADTYYLRPYTKVDDTKIYQPILGVSESELLKYKLMGITIDNYSPETDLKLNFDAIHYRKDSSGNIIEINIETNDNFKLCIKINKDTKGYFVEIISNYEMIMDTKLRTYWRSDSISIPIYLDADTDDCVELDAETGFLTTSDIVQGVYSVSIACDKVGNLGFLKVYAGLSGFSTPTNLSTFSARISQAIVWRR